MKQASLFNLPTPAGKRSNRRKDSPAADPIEEIVGALTDPIIVYPGGWEDTIPERMKAELPLHRLAHVNACLNGKASWDEVCDLEALIYLYTAALSVPLARDWGEIYFYLGTGYMGNKVPEDMRVEKLNDWQERQLREFKRWIYQKKVKVRKERMRREKGGEPDEKKIVAEKNEQLRLF